MPDKEEFMNFFSLLSDKMNLLIFNSFGYLVYIYIILYIMYSSYCVRIWFGTVRQQR